MDPSEPTPPLALVQTPDLGDCLARLRAIEREQQRVIMNARMGALIAEFSNEELRTLCDHWTIGDTLNFRRLGILGPDEGFDGRKKPKRKRATPPKAVSE